MLELHDLQLNLSTFCMGIDNSDGEYVLVWVHYIPLFDPAWCIQEHNARVKCIHTPSGSVMDQPFTQACWR